MRTVSSEIIMKCVPSSGALQEKRILQKEMQGGTFCLLGINETAKTISFQVKWYLIL